jgi:hypothetical protein
MLRTGNDGVVEGTRLPNKHWWLQGIKVYGKNRGETESTQTFMRLCPDISNEGTPILTQDLTCEKVCDKQHDEGSMRTSAVNTAADTVQLLSLGILRTDSTN